MAMNVAVADPAHGGRAGVTAPPSEPLCIRLFGSLELSRGGRPLPPFPTRKARSVFCYLVLHAGRMHPRDLLTGRFWGDHSEQSARRQLSTELWRIRRVLACGLDAVTLRVEEDAVGIQLHAEARLDTAAFEEMLRPAAHRRPEELTPAEVRGLEGAAALYRGALLEEVYDDWCAYERERLRGLALDALFRAMEYHLHRRNWSAALEHGQRLLDADPLNEPAHAALMRCHFGSGNRAAALRQYARCRRLLREELDVEPLPGTVAAYELIRAGSSPDPLAAPPAAAPPAAIASAADALSRLEAAERDLRRANRLLHRCLHTLRDLQGHLPPLD
jgi:DNA-binding SARP family transcriptional activator